jgi:hypothetical protein
MRAEPDRPNMMPAASSGVDADDHVARAARIFWRGRPTLLARQAA